MNVNGEDIYCCAYFRNKLMVSINQFCISKIMINWGSKLGVMGEVRITFTQTTMDNIPNVCADEWFKKAMQIALTPDEDGENYVRAKLKRDYRHASFSFEIQGRFLIFSRSFPDGKTKPYQIPLPDELCNYRFSD